MHLNRQEVVHFAGDRTRRDSELVRRSLQCAAEIHFPRESIGCCITRSRFIRAHQGKAKSLFWVSACEIPQPEPAPNTFWKKWTSWSFWTTASVAGTSVKPWLRTDNWREIFSSVNNWKVPYDEKFSLLCLEIITVFIMSVKFTLCSSCLVSHFVRWSKNKK